MDNHTLRHIEKRALRIAADISRKQGRYRAEIVPDCVPLWYAIKTSPVGEGKAMAYLAARGFGVYRPQFTSVDFNGKSARVRRLDLFPRHLFVCVWDVFRHLRRIHSCPGVVGVLSRDERPVVVPDTDILRMRNIEFEEVVVPRARQPRRRRRPRPTRRKAWANITHLDTRGRIVALHRSLGVT